MADGEKLHLIDADDNVPGWTNGNDSESQNLRAEIIDKVMKKHRLSQLMTILESGWDVNEVLHVTHQYKYTALHRAIKEGWTEGVKILLEAGAKCVSGKNPLALAVWQENCSEDLIRLLLQHGADPNDHDCYFYNIPLFRVVSNSDTGIVKLLLEHGADPNVTDPDYLGEWNAESKRGQWTVLHEAVRFRDIDMVKMILGAKFVTPSALADTIAAAVEFGDDQEFISDCTELLLHGADVNYKSVYGTPLLHLICQYKFVTSRFLQQSLDLFFLNGGDVNIEDDVLKCPDHEDGPEQCIHGTALECAIKHYSKWGDQLGINRNIVRWLIKHGADVAPITFSCIKDDGMSDGFPQLPIIQILLEAGMRVPHGVQTQLSNMEVAIHTWLQENSEDDESIYMTLLDMWMKLERAEKEELQRMPTKTKKLTFPEYRTVQMVDLQEFSDESLDAYPEDIYPSTAHSKREEYQNILNQISTGLEFFSQPRSLQWYCRCSLRNSLVSLQPSVVKTLPLPTILKRYLLCHEI